jgi:hypothetical protein
VRRAKRDVEVEGVEEEREGYFVYSRRDRVGGEVVWLWERESKGHKWGHNDDNGLK